MIEFKLVFFSVKFCHRRLVCIRMHLDYDEGPKKFLDHQAVPVILLDYRAGLTKILYNCTNNVQFLDQYSSLSKILVDPVRLAKILEHRRA